MNTLTKSLKAAGLWGALIALYPFAGAAATAHAQNLVSALYPITWFNGPTHNANGVTFNGTTQYGQCVGLTGTVLTNNCGLTLYLRTNPVAGVTRHCGLTDGATVRFYVIEYADFGGGTNYNRACIGAAARYCNDGAGTAAKIGVLSANRFSATSFKGYHNGTEYLSDLTSDTSTPDAIDGFVGAINGGGTAMAFSPANFALFAAHTGLSATQAATFTTIIEAYQDALGRGVV